MSLGAESTPSYLPIKGEVSLHSLKLDRVISTGRHLPLMGEVGGSDLPRQRPLMGYKVIFMSRVDRKRERRYKRANVP